MAIDEGELDLNVWDATFYKCLFENLQLVGEKRDPAPHCVEGITANESRCKEEAESSIALSTVVAATFGYPQGVEVAHYCEKHRCNVKDAVVAMGLMTQEQAEIWLIHPLWLILKDWLRIVCKVTKKNWEFSSKTIEKSPLRTVRLKLGRAVPFLAQPPKP